MPELSDAYSLVSGGLTLQPGWEQGVPVPAPAAGVASTGRTITGTFWERILLARASFVTSAVVGNRTITARILDPNGNVYWESPASGTVAASSTVVINASHIEITTVSASGLQLVAIPDILLPSGWQFTLLAAGAVDVGDQWSTLNLFVQQVPSDAVHSGPIG